MVRSNSITKRAILSVACLTAAAPIHAQSDAEASAYNAAIVRDFMAELPPSNDGGLLSDIFQGPFYYRNRRMIEDYRFYNKKRQDGVKVDDLATRAQEAFVSECSTKGGYIEPQSNEAMYKDTTYRFGLKGWDSPARLICLTETGDSLGMFAASRVNTLNGFRFVILAISPEAVITQKVRAADAAKERARQEAIRAASSAEIERVANWRNSIQAGAESNCGPVIDVKGDLIQVISRQTRDERWYRRSELSPEFYPDGSRYPCW
ncbi:MAG: hypothetical protein R3E21_13485 [Caenibius sp.]